MEQNSRLSKRSPLHTLLSSLVLRLCHCYLYIGETLYYISSSFISQVTTVFDSWRNKLDMCHGLPANQSHLIYTLWIFFFFFAIICLYIIQFLVMSGPLCPVSLSDIACSPCNCSLCSIGHFTSGLQFCPRIWQLESAAMQCLQTVSRFKHY